MATPAVSSPSSPSTNLRLLSGALSGLTSCVLLQPLDLIKTRLQQTHTISISADLSTRSRTLETIRSVIRNNGVIGLWRGTTPTIIRNVPGSALYFYILSETRFLMRRSSMFSSSPPLSSTSGPRLSASGDLIAGAATRAFVGFLLMPATVIKTRYESSVYNNKWYSVISDGKRFSLSTVKDLFRGTVPTALRDAPYAGLFVLFYERSKRVFDMAGVKSGRPVPAPVRDAASGGLGSVLATLATAPFDTLKTKCQVYPTKYTSMLQGTKLILQERGLAGFFDGVMIRVTRKAASSAIGWSLYEGLVRKWSSRSPM